MVNFKQSIVDWLSTHKSSTLPGMIQRDTQLHEWIISKTSEIAVVKNIMERVYIILNGPPMSCSYGNKLQFDTFDKGYRKGCVLGNKCKCVAKLRLSAQTQTLIEKYGVSTSGQVPGVKEKRKLTNIDRYGTEHVMQNKEVQDKHKISSTKTINERSEINKRSAETYMSKFGVAHHMQARDQKLKLVATNQERYGVDRPLQNTSILAAMKNTISNRTADDVNNSTEKRKLTLLSRFGVDAASKINLSQTTLDILADGSAFNKFVSGKTRSESIDALKISPSALYKHAIKYNASDLFAKSANSKFETEVVDFVKSHGITVIQNTKLIIPPKEIDIYLPELNLAIECNGLYWHSEVSANRDKNYHYNKFEQCRKAGITLITIFDDEWQNNKEKIKKRLLHQMHKSDSLQIFARKCTVKECTAKEVKDFVDENHLQGSVAASINLALVYDTKIVAVMTFSHSRFTKKFHYEILRFCTSCHVPGAASKLFAFFKNKYQPASVVSYSDNRWGSGKLYTVMGLVKTNETVGYFYTDYRQRFNRIKFQKHKLVKAGADENLTEWEIMKQYGYDRVWDCGQTQWAWHK